MKKILFGLLIGIWGICILSSVSSAMGVPGTVCAMTNEAEANELVCFDRDAEGMLGNPVWIPTGGQGSGPGPARGGLDTLESQGSLVYSPNLQWLLAVNAGSDEVSVFRSRPAGPTLVDVADSEGEFPVSVTISGNLVYVLNSMSPNITGFYISDTGQLSPIPGSTRALGSGSFAQVGFNPQGDKLIVTDKGDHEILVFGLQNDDTPSAAPVTTDSNGLAPFGFVFNQDHLLVSEAGSGAASSYEILPDLTLQLISGSVANGQVATCWIATNQQYAFTANTASSNISSYAVKRGQGTLWLLDAMAGAGNLDIDMTVSADGRFLYALNAGSGMIGMFRIWADGSLQDLGMADAGLEIYTQGIAAN